MSYRDVLARSDRKRPDGTPVWPLDFHDRPRVIPLPAAAAREVQS